MFGWGWFLYIAIFCTLLFVGAIFLESRKSKYTENPNLSILSDNDAWIGILIGIVVVASLGGIRGLEIGVQGATQLGWIIGAGLSPLATGSFLWVISLIWTKPKNRMLRLKQFVFWTTVFYMIGLWANLIF